MVFINKFLDVLNKTLYKKKTTYNGLKFWHCMQVPQNIVNETRESQSSVLNLKSQSSINKIKAGDQRKIKFC